MSNVFVWLVKKAGRTYWTFCVVTISLLFAILQRGTGHY